MFRSSMRSSSVSSSFISLSKLLILKTIKIFKKYYQSIVVMWQHMFSMPVMRTVWRRELDCSPANTWLYEKVHELVWIKFNISLGLPQEDLSHWISIIGFSLPMHFLYHPLIQHAQPFFFSLFGHHKNICWRIKTINFPITKILLFSIFS